MHSPIPVAARSEAWVYSRSLTGIAGSNTAGVWVFVSCDCRVLPDVGLCVGLITRPEDPADVVCLSAIMQSLGLALNVRFSYFSTEVSGRRLAQSVQGMGYMGLTFRGPCIVLYSYNKTNEMH